MLENVYTQLNTLEDEKKILIEELGKDHNKILEELNEEQSAAVSIAFIEFATDILWSMVDLVNNFKPEKKSAAFTFIFKTRDDLDEFYLTIEELIRRYHFVTAEEVFEISYQYFPEYEEWIKDDSPKCGYYKGWSNLNDIQIDYDNYSISFPESEENPYETKKQKYRRQMAN